MEMPQVKHARPGTGLPIRAILLVVLTLATYTPVRRNGFTWDDHALIINNPIIRDSDGLRKIWFTTETWNYYPLTWSLCWLECRAWGNNAIGYHAVNVLLHAVNAVLAWLVLRRLKIPGAWLAALVFAVHPVNVATVAWITEQKNTLSMLFYAAAILLYLRFDEEGRWRWYGLSLGAFLLALFSKTAVVMLPVVLLGCVWWLQGRVRRQDLLRSVPFFVLSLVMGLVTIWFERNRDLGGHAPRTEGFLSHLAVAGRAPWFYLYKAVLPLDLTVIYPKWHIDAGHWISYVPGALLVVCFLVFWWKRRTWGRPLLFGLGYFVIMLFPVLGFFYQGFYYYSLVADHWQYNSIIGVIALAVAAGDEACRKIARQHRHWGTAAAVAVVTVMGVASWQRCSVYAADERLWQDNVAKNPRAWLAWLNLGLIQYWDGHLDDAIGYFEQTLRVNPDSADAHSSLGIVLLQLGRTQEAASHLERALRIDPDEADAHNSLALALLRLGRAQEAIPHFEQALRIDPNDVDAHINLGNALFQTGKVSEAFSHYQQALRLDPDSSLAHVDLGVAFEKSGRVPEAIEQYQQALQLKPDLTAARDALHRLQASE
ncbi:MAG: tetratricopeptide repeat protein [Verrucomicrobiia bacterium]